MSAKPIIPFSNLTGGTDDSYLDSWDGAGLSDGQMAFGIVDGHKYDYVLNASSIDSEDGLFRIAPDTNPGTKMWELVWTSKFIGARVSLSSDFSLSAVTATDIDWATENEDTNGFWEGVTNPERFTIPVGVERVVVKAGIQGSDQTDQLVLNINFNGTQIASIDTDNTGGDFLCVGTYPVPVSSGDYFTVNAYSQNARSITASGRTWFSIEAVSFG